jgi:hypothetical protein
MNGSRQPGLYACSNQLGFAVFLAAQVFLIPHARPDVFPAGSSRVDLVKQFLSRPPVVSALTFEHIMLPRQHDAPQTEQGAGRLLRSRFEARWQPGAVFLRQLGLNADLASLHYDPVLVANDGAEYWLLTTNQFADHWIQPDENNAKANSYIRGEVLFQTRLVREVLNLGVMYAEPGSFVWHANHQFAAAGEVPLVGILVDIAGEITVSTEGIPTGLNVVYRFPDTLAIHRVQFSYDESLTDWLLPRRIETFWNNRGSEQKLTEIVIQEIRLQPEPLPKSSFDIHDYIEAHQKTVRVLEGETRYLDLPSGRILFDTIEKQPGRRATYATASPPPWLYFSWAGMNGALFILAVNAVKLQKSKEKG